VYEASFVPEPLIRTQVHLTRGQRDALNARSAETGIPRAQLIRDAIDLVYFADRRSCSGWEFMAQLRRPLEVTEAPPPPRARLREWLSKR
jgi:Ribbon-helix-helix domain